MGKSYKGHTAKNTGYSGFKPGFPHLIARWIPVELRGLFPLGFPMEKKNTLPGDSK